MIVHHSIFDAIAARATGELDAHTTAYITEGGTYVLASNPKWNDDYRPHDLVAIHPTPLDGSRVSVLRPTVNPDFVEALRAALDA